MLLVLVFGDLGQSFLNQLLIQCLLRVSQVHLCQPSFLPPGSVTALSAARLNQSYPFGTEGTV
ncbi:MAG: hypothetical protein KAV99_04390, partial [Candidatus Latescibacteria bacterium]|nr:hypothetical protein [Candidatus Latescibacterota bacterium]